MEQFYFSNEAKFMIIFFLILTYQSNKRFKTSYKNKSFSSTSQNFFVEFHLILILLLTDSHSRMLIYI